MKKTVFSLLLLLNCTASIFSQFETIENGDFSQSNQGWDTDDGDFNFGSTYTSCHTCPGYGYLSTPTGNKGNNLFGSLLQEIFIPSNATYATMSLWFSCNSDEAIGTENDKIEVIIENFEDQIVLGTYYAGGSQQPYLKVTYDIPSQFFGSNCLLTLFGTTNGTKPSVIRVDDVSIIYFTDNNNNYPPVADFHSNSTTITVGQSIQFYDQSSNTPYAWDWEFEGGTPESSSDKNPSVVYMSPGTYNVTLRSSNDEGWSDYVTKTNYITVLDNPSFSIGGTVSNVKINESAGIIENIGLPNVLVSIYNAGSNSVLKTTTTTTNGSFFFDDLNSGQYDIRVSYNGFASKKFSIAPGSNVGFKLPVTLVSQVNTLIGFLESANLELSYGDDNDFLYPTLLYNETYAGYVTDSYQTINNNYDARIESLARLQLAHRALYDYLIQEIPINKITAKSGTELLSTLLSLLITYENLNDAIQQLPWIPSSWKQEVFELKFFIDLTYSAILSKLVLSIPNTTHRAVMESILESLVEIIGDEAKSTSFDPTNLYRWITQKLSDANLKTFYIAKTQKNLDLAAAQSAATTFSGSFSNAFYEVKNQTASSKMDSDEALDFCEDQELYSEISDKISEITGYASDIISAGGLIQIGGILQLVSKVTKGTQIVFLSTAIGQGLYSTNSIGNELANSMESAYNKDNLDSLKYFNPEKQTALNADVILAVNEFNNELIVIRNLVNSNKVSQAINRFSYLRQKNNDLNESVELAFHPIAASLPYVVDPNNFDSSYYRSIYNLYANSPIHRINMTFSLFAVAFDSLNIGYINNFNSIVDSTIVANNNIIPELDNFLPLLLFAYSPAYIVVTEKNIPKYFYPNVDTPVKVKFQNYGNTEGKNVYAKIILSEGFSTTTDSIFIGSMLPGEVDSFTFSILSLQSIGSTGEYSIIFYGDQTDCRGAGGFMVTDQINTIKNYIDHVQTTPKITLSPNPVQDILYIDAAKITIEENTWIRVASAEGVILLNIPANHKQAPSINVRDLDNGIYFVEVISNGLSQARSKFIKI